MWARGRKYHAWVAVLCLSAAAYGQSDLLEKFGSVFDSIAKGLNYVGEKSETLLAPRLVPLDDLRRSDFSGLVAASREFSESYPVRASATVTVTHEWGELRIETWDNPTVHVRAEIAAGAETAELVQKLAEAITIEPALSEDTVMVRTVYPDTRTMGKVAREVNMVVTVPQTASVVCSNSLGDTIVSGIGGTVAVDSRFGRVDLRNINGSVRARVWGGGEFAVQARGLRQGGVFELRRAAAEFSNVAGVLRVSSFQGVVILREIAAEADVDVLGESAPIHLYLAENDSADLTGTALFGTVKSDLEMAQTSNGPFLLARSANLESRRHITLHTTFGELHIHREGASQASGIMRQDGQELVEQIEEVSASVPEGAEVVVDAVAGDLRVEGVDDNRLHVKATRLVRVQSKDAAVAVAKALELHIESLDNRLIVRTAARDDVTRLGCTYYRVNLDIRCPRACPLKIHGKSGLTMVEGMDASTTVEQTEGRVAVDRVKGTLDLTNHRGDVEVQACAGPLAVNAKDGTVTTRMVQDQQTISCVQGKVVIDAPQKGVTVRHRGGDVRVIALDGVGGDYNVLVESGNLSMVVPESIDATLIVTTRNGVVRPPSLPLTGEIGRELQRFTGRINNGLYQVVLETKDGDIEID